MSYDRADAFAEALFSCRSLLLVAVLALALSPAVGGCGDDGSGGTTETAVTYTGDRSTAPGAPETPEAVPGAAATFVGNEGAVKLRLAVARSEAEKARGLMHVEKLPPDMGMIFVYDSPVSGAFWMKNTYVPLSIAFIAPDMSIIDIQDMEPLSLEPHGPQEPYLYAIEANQGFFTGNGIAKGSEVKLEGI